MSKSDAPRPQNAKPKLSNKPVPKEPPKKGGLGGKIVTLLSMAVLIFALVTMQMFSSSIGRMPWDWNKQDWQDYATFSRQTAKDTANKIEQRAREVDWDKLKNQITDKTKELWNKITEVENKIEERLTKERERREAKAGGDSGGKADAGKTESATAATPPKSSYEKALEAMRVAVQHYRNSPGSKSALIKSRRNFEKARDLFEKALGEVEDHRKPEIESMIQECNQYIYDCIKREKL